MWQTLLDALLDTLKVFPFLILIYVLIELLEHKTTLTGNTKILQGNLAPLVGSAAGIIPLCGFSVMAAKLYDKRYIRTGTVMAVFIATSDEALIILLSDVTNMTALRAILPLLAVKFVLALAVGYAVNLIWRGEKVEKPVEHAEEYSCKGEHKHESAWDIYLKYPLIHSLEIAAYLLVVNIIFGLLFYYVGEDKIAEALVGSEAVQPLVSAAVGLIPNCAASVILARAYVFDGMIAFGSMAAGLITNAGMGLVILLKNPKNLKRTLFIVVGLYIIGYLAGVALNYLAPLIGL